MASKIVYVTTKASEVDPEQEIYTRRGLNDMMSAEGWDLEGEKKEGRLIKIYLTKNSRVLAPAPRPAEQGQVTVRRRSGQDELLHQFGLGEGPDPGQQMLSTLGDMASSVAGAGSHLGGGTVKAIPGATIVSGEQVGQCRDAGVHAANMGWPESSNPFPKGSRPWQLWLEHYRMAIEDIDKRVEKDPADYGEDEALAYKQGIDAAHGSDQEVYCPYQGGPLYLAWIRGFAEHGGHIE